jgi:hypothetical protein
MVMLMMMILPQQNARLLVMENAVSVQENTPTMVTTPIPVNPSQARYAWMVAVMGVEHVLME